MSEKGIDKAACAALAACLGASLAAAPMAMAANTATNNATNSSTSGWENTISYGANPCAPGQHEWNNVEDSTPTCMKAGRCVISCSKCGTVFTTTFFPTDHVGQKYGGKAATCTAAGAEAGKACVYCGKIIKQPTAIAALGHDYKKVTVSATCKKDGYTAQQCTRCKDEKNKTAISALGHKWATKWSSNKTYHWKACTRKGCTTVKAKAKHSYKSGKCKVCGKKK